MKKTILTYSLLVLMAGFSTTAVAQQHGKNQRQERPVSMTPEQLAQKKTDQMTKALVLDEQQQKEVYAINLEHAQVQAKLKQERKMLKAKHEAEKLAYTEKLDGTLTADQKEKLAALKAEKMAKKAKRKAQQPAKPIK